MRIKPIDLVDVLVYLVVLGVFTQLFPTVISESFLLSLLTAIILKLVLSLVLWIKKKIIGNIGESKRLGIRVLNLVALFLVLAGSKFLILELIAFVFAGSVLLGNFFQVTALIFALMLAQSGVRRLLVANSDSHA